MFDYFLILFLVACTIACAFNTETRNGEAVNECCNYFKSACCTKSENDFLHTMFIVAIVGSIAVFLAICGCVVCCIVCCVCCANAGSGRSQRPTYYPLRNPATTTVVNTTNTIHA